MIDETSLLVEADGTQRLSAIDLGAKYTLGVESDLTVAEWIGKGMPGAPSMVIDPADHVVAGITALLKDGRRLVIRPAPRRAVGPDLIALFIGTGDRFGTIEKAWLRIHRKDARRATTPLPKWDLDPPLATDEQSLFDRIRL